MRRLSPAWQPGFRMFVEKDGMQRLQNGWAERNALMLNLPDPLAAACAPLFEAIPLDQAMPRLQGSHPRQTALVEQLLKDPALNGRPDLAAALWLYVDDLDRSHTVSQGIENATGSFWHGIMHRREGDFSNSHYWMRRAAGHPLVAQLDPAKLVDDVAAAHGSDSPDLVERQRAEWKALFEWCAVNP